MANKVIEIGVKINGLDTIKSQIDEALKRLEEPIELNINADEAVNKIKKIDKATDDLGKSGKKSGASIGDIAKGFGLMKVGEAILGKLADLFMENETVARAMEIATRALSIIFKDLFAFFTDNIPKVVEFFKDLFENPQKNLEEFGKLIKENIEERIASTIDLFGYLASAVKKVFSGDFAGAMDDAKKAGKEYIDVATGINNTFDRTVDGVKKVAGAVADYTTAIVKNASAQVDQENAAKLAAERAKGRVSDIEAEAEGLRQLRDNTLRSVADRIKSNDELKGKLEELRTAKLAAANADLVVAQNAVNLNKSTANQTALIAAQNAVKQVNADITGQQSEQKQNENALILEQNALLQSNIDATAERAKIARDANTKAITDITDRMDAEKAAILQNEADEKQRIQNIIDNSKEGTQIRVDAENELKKLSTETTIALVENEKSKNLQLQAEQSQHNQAVIANESLSFNTRFAALDAELALINSKTFESEEAKTAAIKANTDARNALRQTEIENELAYLDAAAQVADGLASISKEGGDVQKAFAISSAIISTYTAIAGQLAAFSGVPIPGYAIAQAIATGVFGLLQVKKIAETKPGESKSASSGAAPSASGSALAPQVNLFGNNNNANTVAEKTTEVKPNGEIVVQAYVSETEMTNSQAFIKKVNESGKL